MCIITKKITVNSIVIPAIHPYPASELSYIISNILFNVISTSTNSGENSFGLIGILEILIIFSMSYIFEYGYEIQKDSKGKIYSEEN